MSPLTAVSSGGGSDDNAEMVPPGVRLYRVGRGDGPRSDGDGPVYVATHATDLDAVLRATPPSRYLMRQTTHSRPSSSSSQQGCDERSWIGDAA
jgi:hypothetical protein